MKPVRLWILTYLACFVFIANSVAQSAAADTGLQKKPLDNIKSRFYKSLGNELPLYNGPGYNFYDPLLKGNAYFSETNIFSPGSVFYDGALYNDVPIMYDLYADKVVVMLFNNFTKFSLITERVKSFDILNHHFININADTISNNPGLKSGFYDEVFNKGTQVLVKRTKNIQTTSSTSSGPESYFDAVTYFFIKRKNIYYNVTSQADLLKILIDKKRELEQYIKDNGIKYRKDPENNLVKIISYYDHLTN